MLNPLISVCIPSYECGGRGVELLSKNIESILSQTYKNIEIVVSDHSIDEEIEKYVKNLNNDKIVYLRNEIERGRPAFNTNNAIRNAKGDFIKLMNLDDYFKDTDTLDKIVELINKGHKWVLTGFTHQNLNTLEFSNPLIPHIREDGRCLLEAVNTVGCPSVGLIPKNEFMDETLSYIIDCELWYRMFKKYGQPGIVNGHKIVIGIGNHTLTSNWSQQESKLIYNDMLLCSQKYN